MIAHKTYKMEDSKSKYAKKWSDNNLGLGKCCSCSSERLPNSNRYCKKHYLFIKSKDHFKTTKMWKNLEDILHSQEYKCALTGEDIILGLNDSVDHIIPKSKFSDDTYKCLSNLRWTTRQANSVKNNFTDDELIQFLEKIKEYTQSTKR